MLKWMYEKIIKNGVLGQKSGEKIWHLQFIAVTLHPQKRKTNGSLAQLNRASDYGSEGYRFESCASHSYLSVR